MSGVYPHAMTTLRAAPHVPAYEPRLARVAAVVADPSRSRMLAHLLSGDYATAGELARAASVSAATASGHLARMLDEQFVVAEQRGRHRYFRLASADVAHALEALALVAERGTHERAWARPERARLRRARCCYGHLAGVLGVRPFDTLLRHDCLQPGADGYRLTPAGTQWLARLGCVPAPATSQRRYAYACLDWSERRDHLAGQLADELLAHFIAQGWLRKARDRAVEVTPTGHVALADLLAPPQGAQAA